MLFAIVTLYGNIHLYKKRKQIKDTGLDSYVEACCLWMLFLFTVTEILSVGHVLRFRFLFVIWFGLDALLTAAFVMQWRHSGLRLKKVWEACRSSLDIRKAPYYGILLVIGAFVLGLSLVTTPYNWDSMTYHLPRIAYWAQNRSVEHYATNSIRQISSPVLAEFVNVNVYILCRGHDFLFNLLQGTSYLTCAVLVGAIAGKLSCDRFFRFLAMLLYMSMPIAYAEALTTQVDNFSAVWLLFFVYRLLDYTDKTKSLQFDESTVRGVCTMGLCVAWGYLAKPSVCVGMVVFALWLLIVCIKRRDRVWDLARLFLCALSCVALPMTPEILRNFKTFNAYASPSAGAQQLVGTLHPAYLFVNLLKNLSFNMPTPLVKDGDIIFAKIAVTAASLLQVELDAVSISENGREYVLHEAGNYGCDTAVNPIVLWLFLFCVLWTILRAILRLVLRIDRTKQQEIGRDYFLAAAFSFLAFCTVLRWEPFVSRYMISYLALLCPLIASQIQWGSEGDRRRPFRWGVAGIVSVLCLIEILSLSQYHFEIWKDHARIRPYSYFAARWDELAVYPPIVDAIYSKGYESVGLSLRKADDFEYPFWAMLDGCRLEHIQVKNESAIYADTAFVPDCIIWFGSLPEEDVEINGKTYGQVTEFGKKQYLLEQ